MLHSGYAPPKICTSLMFSGFCLSLASAMTIMGIAMEIFLALLLRYNLSQIEQTSSNRPLRLLGRSMKYSITSSLRSLSFQGSRPRIGRERPLGTQPRFAQLPRDCFKMASSFSTRCEGSAKLWTMPKQYSLWPPNDIRETRACLTRERRSC